jgi:PAS domain-containing protein
MRTSTIIRDTTERKQVQEILQTKEYKYRSLFDNIQEMITVYEVERDNEGRIIGRRLIDGNPSFVRTTKYASIDEIRTKTSSEVFGREWADNHLQAIQEAMDINEVRTQEVYLSESGRDYITTVVPLDANTSTLELAETSPSGKGQSRNVKQLWSSCTL